MDSMQLRMQRNVAVERAPRRWLFREELRRVTPYERKIGPSVDALIVLSERDGEFFPGAASTAVANGVDTEIFAPDPALREPDTIVFSGIMSYPPNVAAARWFAERCFPAVREAIPDARLLLAGSSPPADLLQLGRRDGVTVTGYVESMPATLNRASVAVAPMLSGAGMQNKVLEAMACELAVVTTPLGLGSIRAEPGHELVVAEGAEAFAAAVVELLRDPDRAQELGERARACVIERHSWEHAAGDVEAIYERILSRRPSEAAL
jgi:glycosyltransferase involved in cell wall biosynthesis